MVSIEKKIEITLKQIQYLNVPLSVSPCLCFSWELYMPVSVLATYVSTLVFPVSPCVCVGLPKTQCLPHNPWESSGLGKQGLLLQNVDAKSLI